MSFDPLWSAFVEVGEDAHPCEADLEAEQGAAHLHVQLGDLVANAVGELEVLGRQVTGPITRRVFRRILLGTGVLLAPDWRLAPRICVGIRMAPLARRSVRLDAGSGLAALADIG